MTGESYTSLIDGNPITVAEDRIDIQSSATSVTLSAGCGNIQRVTFTAAGQSLILPASTTYSVGHEFIIDNVGAESFSVKTTGSATTLGTASAGSLYYVYLYSKATAEGTWGFRAMAGGGASAGANSDITSLTGLTTPLSVGQGGTGLDADTTGAATHFVRQASTGAAFTVGAIVAADLPVMVGDSGSGGTKGAAPAPSAGDAAASKFLKADGTWAVPSGSGAAASEPYLTVGNTTGLSAERALTAGTGLSASDGGADSTYTLSVTRPVPDFTSNTLKMPRVNAGETALEYRTMTQVTAALDAATDALQGAVELLTTAEAVTGTDTTRAATAAGLAAACLYQGVHTLWVPAATMQPRTTNGAAVGLTELATNDVMLSTFDFDQTTSEAVQFNIGMPKSWNEGTVTATYYWTAASGAGTAIWGMRGLAVSEGDAMDASWGSAVTVTDTLTTANDCHISDTSSAITIGGSPAENDLVFFEVYRDISDTLTADAKLIGVKLHVTLSAKNDA